MFLTAMMKLDNSGREAFASQSPQIGSMFLTRTRRCKYEDKGRMGRNPLKSGQCFLPSQKRQGHMALKQSLTSQSPQIGSMFLTNKSGWIYVALPEGWHVAIPSNRVNVSYSQISLCVGRKLLVLVAIPSNRVNVSYLSCK